MIMVLRLRYGIVFFRTDILKPRSIGAISPGSYEYPPVDASKDVGPSYIRKRGMNRIMPKITALLMCAFAITIAFSACSLPFGASSAKTYTAQQILAMAQNAPLTDTTFTIEKGTYQDVSSPSYQLNITGSGILTTNPHYERDHIQLTVNDSQSSYDEVIDDRGYSYIKMPTLDWYTQSPQANDAIIWNVGVLGYAYFQNPTLIKSDELLNGIKTWHIKCDVSLAPGVTTGTLTQEVWIREDNHFPAQTILHYLKAPAAGNNAGGTSPGGNFNLKVLFTAWNSNLTIDLPQ
jgi:hypothetical protein